MPAGSPPDLTGQGLTCLQSAFPGTHDTAANIAHALGIEVLARENCWGYIPTGRVQAIRDTFARWAEDARNERTVTREHISLRIVHELVPNLAARHYATMLKLEFKRPSPGEDEVFVRVDQLPAIFAAARSAPDGREGYATEDRQARLMGLIAHKGLDGLTWQQAKQRGLL